MRNTGTDRLPTSTADDGWWGAAQASAADGSTLFSPENGINSCSACTPTDTYRRAAADDGVPHLPRRQNKRVRTRRVQT